MPALLELEEPPRRDRSTRRAAQRAVRRPFLRADRRRLEKNPQTLADLADPEMVAKAVIARLRTAAEYRSDWEPDWEFAMRAWRQLPTADREDSWESDRYLPLILKHVETALPSVVAAVLDQKGLFRMRGVKRKGKEAARALQTLVNHLAAGPTEAEVAYERMFWWATLIGTAYLDHGWDRRIEERTVPVVRDDFDEAKGRWGKVKAFTRKRIRVADHPTVTCLNPWNVYPDPCAVPGDDNEWFIIRVTTTLDDLRALAREGGHLDEEALERWVEEVDPANNPTEGSSDWFDAAASQGWDAVMQGMGYRSRLDRNNSEFDPMDGEKPVVVLKYVSKKETVTLGSPRHVIGYSPNPFLHGKTGIVVHHFLEMPDSPYGRGLGGILRGHQELANQNINAWMDTVMLELMAPIVVDKSRAQLLDEELVVQPNALIRVRGVDAIQRMQMPAPTNVALQVDAHLAHDADDLTGFTEQARGMAPNASQTATAFQGIQSNLRTRLIMHVRRGSRTVRYSGQILQKLCQQFYSRTQVATRTGEDGLEYVEIEPWEIVGDVEVEVAVSTARASPDAQAQRLLQLLQVVTPLLQTGAIQDPRVRRMVRMVLEGFEVEDIDLILPRGYGDVKDPIMENELLAGGIPVPVSPTEPHALHVQHHHPLLQELLDSGADDTLVAVVKAHIDGHFQAAQAQAAQAQMQAAGVAPPGAGGGGGAPQASSAGIGPGGGGPVRQGATLASRATGGQGTPGVAAPGPIAPGRTT